MFGKRFKLFKMFGFEVRADLSWLVIVTLVVWSLAEGVFPAEFPGQPWGTYVLMGLAGALGLFASVVVHEMCHSFVAQHYGLPMNGITLFIFGGVAEMSDEPPSAKTEFLMAVAGPISSLIIGLAFLLVASLDAIREFSTAAFVALRWIGIINIFLAAVNLIPGYPLDGGRILRSILWYARGNMRSATRMASYAGEGFGLVLIGLGFIGLLTGSAIGGMWNILIGWFLWSAARQSYQQVLIRQALQGEPVQRFMAAQPVTVPPTMSIEQLVNDYVYHYHYKMFPVVDGGELTGCITTRQIREVPRAEWATRTVGEVVNGCCDTNTILPDADAMAALAKMSRTGASRLLVVDGRRRLVGIVSLKDLMGFLARKLELEGDGPDRPGP
jgi:Zn-dependent protease/CBS domain-containing protein